MTQPKKITCLNCDREFSDEYDFCPYCGQEKRKLEFGFKHMIAEFLSANFNIDSKLFLTIKLLLFSPAFLSIEYLKGRHKKYISPIRIYLIISLIYFFTLSVSSTVSDLIINDDDIVTEQRQEGFMESVSDSLAHAKPVEDSTQNFLQKYLRAKAKQLDTKQGKSAFLNSIHENISKGMFLLMPLTAFVFFLFFYKKRSYYYEHLIFIIHLHSVLFFTFTLFILIGLLVDNDFVFSTEVLLELALIFTWIKKFYSTSFWGTLWRMVVILAIMGGLLFLFIILVALVSLLLY